MITRTLVSTIIKNQKKGFINIIYGPRRVGKTVLLGQLINCLEAEKSDVVWFNGDTQEAREALSNTSEVWLKQLVKKYQFVVIDEAQRIKNIGLSLKILIDYFPQKIFFVSGSSSLMLARGLREPLTGRAIKYNLYPLSTTELTLDLQDYQKKSLLASQLVYGGYPHLLQLSTNKDKSNYLKSIVEDYLFKDVLLLSDISFPETLRKLAILLAFQIGSEVSFNELANNLGIDVKTVQKYLVLLKQSFVIFELGAFSKNLRNEVVKSKKYYFWDLGIRNALIGQFLPLDSRIDKGQLWENFLVIERVKKHKYKQIDLRYYFWRTWNQAEIDWIETDESGIKAFEFKFNQSKKVATPKAFVEAYGQKVKLINQENYLWFVDG
jgi:uncharacterized protein